MQPRSGTIEPASSNAVVKQHRAQQDTRRSICIVVAVRMTIEALLVEQLIALMPLYQITLAANCPDKTFLHQFGLDLELVHVPMQRNFAPLQDLQCLLKLFCLFRSRNFALVHSITPKAGLLSMLAAFFARVPLRLHTFTGQVWATRIGWKRKGLKSLDWLLAIMTTHLLSDSRSQLQFLCKEKVVSAHKAGVLGSGSISGVNLERFRPREEEKHRIRQELDIPLSALVFGFLGRLKKDKGVLDLAHAFGLLSNKGPRAYLIVAGPDEENLTQRMTEFAGASANRIRFVDWTRTPELYMAAFDLLCLPSYREGFGSVIIEAAACGVPAIASRIYGISDAVVDGVTGILHECGDIPGIVAGMQKALDQVDIVAEMGINARERAQSEFSSRRLSSELISFYDRILKVQQQSRG